MKFGKSKNGSKQTKMKDDHVLKANRFTEW